MSDSPLISEPITGPDPQAIQRLLAALGEWGVAEVEGASEPTLQELEGEALDAFRDVAAVA